MASFADQVAEMDDLLFDGLADGITQHLSRNGEVLVEALPTFVDVEAERLDAVSGGIDRVRTHQVQKSLLQPFDRQGSFFFDGRVWHIDGIAADDGDLITLYVVP